MLYEGHSTVNYDSGSDSLLPPGLISLATAAKVRGKSFFH